MVIKRVMAEQNAEDPATLRNGEHRRKKSGGGHGRGKSGSKGHLSGRLLLEPGGDGLCAGGEGERAVWWRVCRRRAMKGLRAGEVMLFSKGASVKVSNEGKILLNGDVYVQGDLYVNGQKMEVP